MSTPERNLVGAVLRDPTVYERVQVQSEHFSDLAMRLLWKSLGDLSKQKVQIDELVLADSLTPEGLAAVGGLSGISALVGATAQNADYYADKVRDRFLSDSVRRKASEILQADEGTSGADMLSLLSSSSEALTGSLSRPEQTLGSVVGKEVAGTLSASGEPLGLPTGWGVDRWIPGGLPRSKVVMLFADTGSFKTTAVNQLMFNLARNAYQGLLIPLEDSDELTAHRWMSRMSGVHYGRIAGGVCNAAERQKISLLSPGDWAHLDNIRSADGIEPNIDHILRAVASAKARGGLDYVIVDYMQLLEGRGSPQDIITRAMKKAANAAKRYNIVWIFLSQQNEKNMHRTDPRPHLVDLFGSGSMKQMAKTVFALFRPHEHWPKPTMNHPLHGMYAKFIERNAYGADMYENLIELWMLKNVLGRKKSMQVLVAKPEVGILDPVDIRSLS